MLLRQSEHDIDEAAAAANAEFRGRVRRVAVAAEARRLSLAAVSG